MICSKKTSGALDFNHLFVETIEIKGTVVKTAPDSMADVPVCYTESLPYFYEIILLAKSKFVNVCLKNVTEESVEVNCPCWNPACFI